jgi:Flp pilus assembly protein TadD
VDDAALARAQGLVVLRRYPEAEALLRGLVGEEPDAPQPLVLLAHTLLAAGRPAEAVGIARRAVAVDPDQERAHRLLAGAELGAGHRSAAERAAREAVRLAPGEWQAHCVLGAVLRERRSGTEEALDCALEAIRLAPHEPAAHNLAGLCYGALGLPARATEEFEEALRLDPADATAMNNLAALRLRQGDIPSAGARLTSGLAVDPQQELLHQNYLMLLRRIVRRLHVALAVVGIVLITMVSTGASYPARALTGLAFLAVYGAATVPVLRALPRGTLRAMGGLLGRSRGSRLMSLAILATLAVAVLVLAFAPAAVAQRAAPALLGTVLLLAVASVLRQVVDRRPSDRSLPGTQR